LKTARISSQSWPSGRRISPVNAGSRWRVSPQEPAQALLFLASPLASFTTGAALDVSGGFCRHL
jgi:NAD(P)-dependent dehydrogenase (short-subunit alcohol dehydrogenase family)